MAFSKQPRRTTGPIADFQLVSIREGADSCLGSAFSKYKIMKWTHPTSKSASKAPIW